MPMLQLVAMAEQHTNDLDPDVRFLLANERTLLAWVRTGLTLQAGGFAIVHLAEKTPGNIATGLTAILLGGILAIIGYRRFKEADRAIRQHRLPPAGRGPAAQVIAVVAAAVLLALTQLIALL